MTEKAAQMRLLRLYMFCILIVRLRSIKRRNDRYCMIDGWMMELVLAGTDTKDLSGAFKVFKVCVVLE
jgi:hypothetical protein